MKKMFLSGFYGSMLQDEWNYKEIHMVLNGVSSIDVEPL